MPPAPGTPIASRRSGTRWGDASRTRTAVARRIFAVASVRMASTVSPGIAPATKTVRPSWWAIDSPPAAGRRISRVTGSTADTGTPDRRCGGRRLKNSGRVRSADLRDLRSALEGIDVVVTRRLVLRGSGFDLLGRLPGSGRRDGRGDQRQELARRAGLRAAVHDRSAQQSHERAARLLVRDRGSGEDRAQEPAGAVDAREAGDADTGAPVLRADRHLRDEFVAQVRVELVRLAFAGADSLGDLVAHGLPDALPARSGEGLQLHRAAAVDHRDGQDPVRVLLRLQADLHPVDDRDGDRAQVQAVPLRGVLSSVERAVLTAVPRCLLRMDVRVVIEIRGRGLSGLVERVRGGLGLRGLLACWQRAVLLETVEKSHGSFLRAMRP